MEIDTTTILEGAAEVALSLVGLAFPVALPVIAIVKEAVPAFIAAKPYIDKAIADGESAFAAAEKASPDLGGRIRALARQIDPQGLSFDQHLDKITCAGVNRDWIDDRWRTDAGTGV